MMFSASLYYLLDNKEILLTCLNFICYLIKIIHPKQIKFLDDVFLN